MSQWHVVVAMLVIVLIAHIGVKMDNGRVGERVFFSAVVCMVVLLVFLAAKGFFAL